MPPSSVDPDTENSISNVRKEMTHHQSRYLQPMSYNITPRQWSVSESLKFHNQFISIEADKNLGGCFLLCETYTSRGISEHIGNKYIYKPRSRQEAINHLQVINQKISVFISKHQDEMFSVESHFLLESLHKHSDNMARIPLAARIPLSHDTFVIAQAAPLVVMLPQRADPPSSPESMSRIMQ